MLTVLIAASVAKAEIVDVYERPRRVLNNFNKRGRKQMSKWNLMYRIKIAAQMAQIAAQIGHIATKERQKMYRRRPDVYKMNTHNLFWWILYNYFYNKNN